MKTVVLNDTDGRENLGCRLTSSTLKRQIERELGREFASFELTAFPWAFGKGKHTGRAWRTARSWMRNRKNPDGEVGFPDWLAQLAEQEYGPDAVRASLNANLVVCHPEGSISDYHDAVRILNLLSLPLLACLHGIPTCTANGTFPLFPPEDRRFHLLQVFLDACLFVALRDRMTAEHYGGMFMPDSAIMYEPLHPPVPPEARSWVLITTGAHLAVKTNRAIAKQALRFCDQYQLQPLILTKKHQDLHVLEAEVTRRGGHFLRHATLEEAEQWISQCALHIGGRYHMALLGIRLDVPSVLIQTNTHKNTWLAEEFHGIERVDHPDDIPTAAHQLRRRHLQNALDIAGSVHAAQACFIRGMHQATAIIRERLTTKPGPKPMGPPLGTAVADLLRRSDSIPFRPLRAVASRLIG